MKKILQAKKNVGFIFQHILDHHRGIFFVTLLCFLLESFLVYSQPYLFSRLFQGSLLETFSWRGLWNDSRLLLLVMMAGVIVQAFAVRLDIDFLTRLGKTLMQQVYRKLLYFDITLHENESSGKYLGKTRRSVDKMISGIDMMLYQFFPAFFEVLFVHVVFFYYSFRGGLLLTLTFFFLISFAFFVSYFLNQIFKAAFDQENKISAFFVESLSLIRTIRFFSKEDHFSERSEVEFGKMVTIWQEKLSRLTLLLGMKNVFLWLQGFLFAFFIIWQYRLGVLDTGSGLFLIILVPLYIRSLGSVARLIDRMADFYAGVEQYCSVMAQEEIVVNQESVLAVPEHVSGKIAFDHVTFRYEGTDEDQFEDFSIEFVPGKTTAIVGSSGSGKSTLVKLLFRLYDVSSGAILLDGTDIRKFDQREYRRLLAIVPQDVELFNASIRENIILGDDFSDEEVWAALKLAVLEDRVKQMANGLDTEVGERGVKLSGGEKQRLGIARALIRNPKILVLDEATSSLDTLSERLVKEAIYNVEHLDITVIVIAHRLSTIQDADEILVFERGQIVERGTHTELIAKQGTYASLQGEQIVNTGV
jgi:ABC-type multidrug transport system fused ATPase/permease subunit